MYPLEPEVEADYEHEDQQNHITVLYFSFYDVPHQSIQRLLMLKNEAPADDHAKYDENYQKAIVDEAHQYFREKRWQYNGELVGKHIARGVKDLSFLDKAVGLNLEEIDAIREFTPLWDPNDSIMRTFNSEVYAAAKKRMELNLDWLPITERVKQVKQAERSQQ